MNGYGINFWGWGREDDNMRQRLLLHGMFPPERPAVPTRTRRFYFEHQKHQKALEVLLYMAHDISSMRQMSICVALDLMVDIMLMRAYMSFLKPMSAAHIQRSFCYAIISMHVMHD